MINQNKKAIDNFNDINVVINVVDVLTFMERYTKYNFALNILNEINIIKKCSFAIVQFRINREVDVYISCLSHSEEEIIIENDLENNTEDRIITCIGLKWCENNNRKDLYEKALKAFADYVVLYIDETRKNTI